MHHHANSLCPYWDPITYTRASPKIDNKLISLLFFSQNMKNYCIILITNINIYIPFVGVLLASSSHG